MPDEKTRKSFWGSRSGLMFIGFALVAGYFLWTEHRAHVVAGLYYLPFLLLLACPLMHLFHGHGHGDSDGEGKEHDHAGHEHGKRKGGDAVP